jgi:hypothetical protein
MSAGTIERVAASDAPRFRLLKFRPAPVAAPPTLRSPEMASAIADLTYLSMLPNQGTWRFAVTFLRNFTIRYGGAR